MDPEQMEPGQDETLEREWYYIQSGLRLGPAPERVIREMIRDGQITLDTMVWTKGMENLAPISETDLAELFGRRAEDRDPHLRRRATDRHPSEMGRRAADRFPSSPVDRSGYEYTDIVGVERRGLPSVFKVPLLLFGLYVLGFASGYLYLKYHNEPARLMYERSAQAVLSHCLLSMRTAQVELLMEGNGREKDLNAIVMLVREKYLPQTEFSVTMGPSPTNDGIAVSVLGNGVSKQGFWTPPEP